MTLHINNPNMTIPQELNRLWDNSNRFLVALDKRLRMIQDIKDETEREEHLGYLRAAYVRQQEHRYDIIDAMKQQGMM